MPKRVLEGVVVSAKMKDAVVVEVARRVMHRLYKKFVRTTKKYHAHDETGAKPGDTVRIVECRPFSKTIAFEVVKK
ncbi:MAG: 30S ribosomal protein S17 [Rickettsiales bacterium]|jgi:small subunit ribosomal protein S17|nr:30S ribosomal protein S17 [Rickettsiales bacterium]